jgi:thiol-disulfide isomerase/thioredoxin
MYRLKYIAVLIGIFLTSASQVFASGYNIRVRIDGLQDTTLLLAYHFGNRKYIKDTIQLDSGGSGVFRGDEALPGGIYLVVMPEMDYFELLIDREQDFSIETTHLEPVRNMQIKGSEENRKFIAYHRFMNEKQASSSALQKRIEQNRNHPDSMLYLQSRGRALDQEVQDYWNSIIENNPGTLLASLISAMKNPEIPEFEIPAGTSNPDSLKWTMGYDYNKSHYFDNIDFSDERLLRTPILHNKIENFFTRILIQQPAFIIPEAVRIVEMSKASNDVFQYVLVFLLNHFERSHIMGLDEVFVELAERYYLSGDATWVNTETLEKLRERVERLKPNLIGRKAAEMKMRTPEGSFASLHDTEAAYTIIYFYEPSCGHCKVVTPRLNKLYDKYRDSGLKIFAVYIYEDVKEWTEYIGTNNLDWINVFDPQNETYFRHYYDVYSTPTIYILDSEKTIIAKRIGIETVEQMMEELL